jgi:hypothetical protein
MCKENELVLAHCVDERGALGVFALVRRPSRRRRLQRSLFQIQNLKPAPDYRQYGTNVW